MALTRRSGTRFTGNIWPGFVDAMTALLLVLMFVLSIFMIVQSILRNTVSSQETELNALTGQVASLAEALGLEQQTTDRLETQVGLLSSNLDAASEREVQQNALIASLTSERDAALGDVATQAAKIADFEAQVATLLAQNSDLAMVLEERDTALVESEEQLANTRATLAELEEANAREISNKEALQLALASARDEIDAAAEEARLAAARTDALNALIADLRTEASRREADLAAAQEEVAETSEVARLAQSRREALEALVLTLRRDLDESTQAATTTSDKLEQTLALLNATRADLSEVQSDLENTRSTLNNINEGQLRADLTEAQAALDESERARLLEMAAAATLRERLQDAEATLSAREAKQLADAAAAEALRERLKNADAELTAMTLNLEEQRRRAEETLTLLAAVRAENNRLQQSSTKILSKSDKERIALLQAQELLSREQEKSAEALLQVEVLNQQTAQLRSQLNSLQALLDDANSKDSQAQVQIDALGKNLNTALARVASEQKKLAAEQERIAKLEAAEVERLAAEALDLRSYRSEFFGKIREILGDREGVQVQGDRFVFSSEVLFPVGSANLGAAGRQQISKVAEVLRAVATEIPSDINWILRVDGHTDRSPLGFGATFADNWELSQARALSVVRYLINFEGIPPERLAATGFGEFQPVDLGNSLEALARNRRIELKLTEK